MLVLYIVNQNGQLCSNIICGDSDDSSERWYYVNTLFHKKTQNLE